MISAPLWFAATGPILLLLAGILPRAVTSRFPVASIRLALAAALASLLVAIGTAVAVAGHGALRTNLVGSHGLGLGLYLDALSATMSVLVAFVGVIVVNYSRNYLDGDPNHVRFVRWLCLTLASILVAIISGNLLLFFAAWYATSLRLHRLLLFYPERQGALLAARKKWLASRLGDLCLVVAMGLLYFTHGSLDYAVVFAGTADAAASGSLPASHAAVAVLLVFAALLKSAQFPTHGWLIEVMETPTPVSALLHAGIINAGGFLVLRFAGLITPCAAALDTLAIVGGFSALFGSMAMLTQTSIKVSLAYSTIAQMGFMMLECGLGAFPAALLHIVAHSLYKAHAFLSSGSVIDIARASWTPSPGGKPHPARVTISVAAVMLVTLVVSIACGASPRQQPGVFALGMVVSLGMIHLLANAIDERPTPYVIGRTVVLAAVVAGVYFTLQLGFERLVGGSLPRRQPLHGVFELLIVVSMVLSFGAVTVFQNLLPGAGAPPRWEPIYAHVSNGLYVNTLANRWVLWFWPPPPAPRTATPSWMPRRPGVGG